MVILRKGFNREDPFLRLVKKTEKNLWNIYFFDHSETGKEYTIDQNDDLKMTGEVVMNAKDLKRFAGEVRRVIQQKPDKEILMQLTFRKNKPKFVVEVQFMQKEGQHLYREKVKGKMQFTPLISTRFNVYHHNRPEDQYVYDEGNYTGIYMYYDIPELTKFADDLEKEAEENK